MIEPATFWWCVTMACIVWFSTITIYVAIRGAIDIKHMLARLSRIKEESDGSSD